MSIESLPVELIADILSELDLDSLVKVSYLSRRLHHIASDSSLNPWRQPILRSLRSAEYGDSLRTLSVRTVVPRRNWHEILCLATPEFLVYEATLPNLSEKDWQECFRRRYLPGWIKWKKERSRWREAFIKMLTRVSHRALTSCTMEEAWTKYIVLNRNGSANQHDGQSRNFNPLVIFNEMKLQSNLAHLETHIRLLVQLTDVRILALGVLHHPRNAFLINWNARALLHPDCISKDDIDTDSTLNGSVGKGSSTTIPSPFTNFLPSNEIFGAPTSQYEPMTHPQPAASHAQYPLYTPGGGDKRWLNSRELEEQGRHWVGGLMLVAQLLTPETCIPSVDGPALQDLDLVVGPGRSRYASLTWADLAAIAPWMKDKITKMIDGPGLGI